MKQHLHCLGDLLFPRVVAGQARLTSKEGFVWVLRSTRITAAGSPRRAWSAPASPVAPRPPATTPTVATGAGSTARPSPDRPPWGAPFCVVPNRVFFFKTRFENQRKRGQTPARADATRPTARLTKTPMEVQCTHLERGEGIRIGRGRLLIEPLTARPQSARINSTTPVAHRDGGKFFIKTKMVRTRF